MMEESRSVSYLFGSNAQYLEELYERYLTNPTQLDEYWRRYFDELVKQPGSVVKDRPHIPIREAFAKMAQRPRQRALSSGGPDKETMQKQLSVLHLMTSYRILGSRKADLDPLKRRGREDVKELTLEYHDLSSADLTRKFGIDSSLDEGNFLALSEIVSRLEQTYCRTIGVEYMHIANSEEKIWIRDRFEDELSTPNYDVEMKRRILRELTGAETFERYLHTRYVGQKRFSLEGSESLIPGLNSLIHASTAHGFEEVIIGMAHRGRLNVLINTLGKRPADLFSEFEDKQVMEVPSGDVKYHNGFTAEVSTPDGPVHVVVEFNPSHLEIVNPVVEGNVRARQTHRGKDGKDKVLPVLIHGDSAFIGLGVNQATFNMSQTRGYTTGGTVHLVVNNQIGFTTSDVRDNRSTVYCTDIAKMIDAPIFHVNGDDPEAVCYVIGIALEYRMRFHKDVVVDIVCFRKLGHNEADDPVLTQPMMYKKIKAHPGTRAMYAERLAREGAVSAEESAKMIEEYRTALDKGEQVSLSHLNVFQKKWGNDWSVFKGTVWTHPCDTSLKAEDIKLLGERLTQVPDNFALHRTVRRTIESRMKMALGEQPFDWGMAETLAYASLVVDGTPVRISGEDSGRGTFSHRHAVFHDQNRERWDEGSYIPLQYVREDQAQFLVIDSILNEEAVCAFEYGYAVTAPNDLVIWEAQFGDFANGAQVAIDQFITSGETKWGRLCGLTLILPHGYDGQGPEHSSARLERWLQLCSEKNIQIVMMSESAQMFHVLRRQILRPYRKPLVIFLSKRLLRYPGSMSDISLFTAGSGFRPVIGDVVERERPQDVKRVILCSGQVYYDLADGRAARGLEDKVAIVRLEQLYPFPYEHVTEELAKYPAGNEIVWAQEEPKNQGGWYQLRHRIEKILEKRHKLSFAGRPASASPAVGYKSKHDAQLKQLVEDAFSDL